MRKKKRRLTEVGPVRRMIEKGGGSNLELQHPDLGWRSVLHVEAPKGRGGEGISRRAEVSGGGSAVGGGRALGGRSVDPARGETVVEPGGCGSDHHCKDRMSGMKRRDGGELLRDRSRQSRPVNSRPRVGCTRQAVDIAAR